MAATLAGLPSQSKDWEIASGMPFNSTGGRPLLRLGRDLCRLHIRILHWSYLHISLRISCNGVEQRCTWRLLPYSCTFLTSALGRFTTNALTYQYTVGPLQSGDLGPAQSSLKPSAEESPATPELLQYAGTGPHMWCTLIRASIVLMKDPQMQCNPESIRRSKYGEYRVGTRGGA